MLCTNLCAQTASWHHHAVKVNIFTAAEWVQQFLGFLVLGPFSLRCQTVISKLSLQKLLSEHQYLDSLFDGFLIALSLEAFNLGRVLAAQGPGTSIAAKVTATSCIDCACSKGCFRWKQLASVRSIIVMSRCRNNSEHQNETS